MRNADFGLRIESAALINPQSEIRIPHSSLASLQPSLAQRARFGRGALVNLDAVVRAPAARGWRAREAQADVGKGLVVGRRLDAVDVSAEEICEVEARRLGGDAAEVFDRVGATAQVVAVARALRVVADDGVGEVGALLAAAAVYKGRED